MNFMDTKAYIDFVLSVLKGAKLDLNRLKLILYFLSSFFLTPFINFLLENSNCGGICGKVSSWLSFNDLPLNQLVYISAIWITGWVLLFVLVNTFFMRWFLPVRVWQNINKFVNKLGFLFYKLNAKKWPSEWLLQGGIRMDTSQNNNSSPALVVSYSNSGSLLKDSFLSLPKRWKNFEMSFDLYFPYLTVGEDNKQETRALGIIFRAQDLENYYMIQLRAWCKNSCNVLLKPHVRILGNWEVFDIKEEDLLALTKFDSVTDPLHVTLRVNGLFADVYIRAHGDSEDINIYRWALPSNTEVNTVQHPGNNNDPSNSGFVPKISFRECYGMVGFRAYPGEISIIRNLKIISI